ncbi:MBL fold metallo-hydrolase [Paenibacillus lignilyticus]|uniref:MBL fold metallo-hydrolase n=1 Tax=Paenibacillus lignilyticus TaxID=1172615 RepID=A0ABS5CJP7_9BACL|nr:MBL fold metallo-hydrolase [Paenibacillus lignilyticus]MBP3966068.1 MBL fold metallo-hydrolase [Paenibacillus lignilyticus]
MLKSISTHLFQYEDTCLVYVIRSGSEAVLIDFGSGAVLEELASIGVDKVTDVLMTHHHRDQGQGLDKAVAAGARVWVPHHEQDLFARVDQHWQGREILVNYNVRQDKFSLLEPISIAGTLKDYANYTFGEHAFNVVPTPGHTTGSITLTTLLDGSQVAFTGDLIAGPGKVWSMSATQWSYNGCEGVIHTLCSISALRDKGLHMLLPSHGEIMERPSAAIDPLIEKLEQLLRLRGQYADYESFKEPEFREITPHLLWNARSFANSFVLLSENGKALLIDYGYANIHAIFIAGTDRASRRPSLFPIERLKKQFNVSKIDVVIPTHYHDDHVAGFNLLRDVEGTETWVADNFADLFEHPYDYDVPCIWYDPIPVDRRIPLEQTVVWEGYDIRLYEQPGHTLYAVAISFEVDGKRVLAIGDQQGNDGNLNNYVYQNRFRSHDYVLSAELYKTLNPDLIISGHWDPLWVEEGYFDKLQRDGESLKQLHDELLPLEQIDLGAEGYCAWIKPYQIEMSGGETTEIAVEVLNPFPQRDKVTVRLVTLPSWSTETKEQQLEIDSHKVATVQFAITAPAGFTANRARIAVDITIGDRKLGQQAEALVTVK